MDESDNRLVDLNRSLPVLKNINWDFFTKATLTSSLMEPFDCRKYHSYPATYPPEIPYTIIEVLTKPGAEVLDPFGGVGTTFFQALLLDRMPQTTEVCSVSIDYMRSLLALLDPNVDCLPYRDGIEELVSEYDEGEDYCSRLKMAQDIEKLEPWYTKKTFNELCYLVLQERGGDHIRQAIMKICMSGAVRSACSQKKGWGCISDNMIPKEKEMVDGNLFQQYLRLLGILLNDIEASKKRADKDYPGVYEKVRSRGSIYHEDIRKCQSIGEGSIDLVVTSPPYPNMTDYVNSQRLSYYYLGDSMKEDLSCEIGARIKRFKDDSLERYRADMSQANSKIASFIRPGGYACYVMPEFNKDNVNNKKRKDVVAEVMQELTDLGLDRIIEFERILPTRRRSHNMKWVTLEREKIYLFQKV